MARVKSDKANLIVVKNWEHADELIHSIGVHQQTIQDWEAKTKREIDQVKANMIPQVKICQDAIDRYAHSLEAFATAHKTELGRNRSRKLNFGILGWRKSTSIKIKKTTLGRIKKVLSKARAAACIRVKESVDKDALAKLTDKQLASVGARRDVKDVFFVEPDITKAADYCD